MRRAAIVTPLRTPVGRSWGLSTLPAEVLGAEIIKAVVAKSGVEPARIEDVVLLKAMPTPRRPASAAGRPWRRGCPLRCQAFS